MATTEQQGKRGQAAVTVETGDADVHVRFADGRVLHMNTAELTPAIIGQAVLHGLKQKLVDAAAISRNPDTGASATVEDKYQAISRVMGNLKAGEWNKRAAAGEGAGGGLLFRALCQLYGDKTPEQIREFLGKLDRTQQAALRASAKVAPIIEELKAKDDAASAGKAGIDADKLLAGLE